MKQIHHSRPSGSKYIDKVWTSQNITNGVYKATPDGCWDLIVLISKDDSRSMMLTGQASKTAMIPYTAGSGSVVISFAAGTYIPQISCRSMLDLVELLPNTDADHFELLGQTFEIPTYDTAEKLVEDMTAAGMLAADDVVAAVLNGSPMAMSDRNMQRHFVQATGLTRNMLFQIRRAQQAVALLKSGEKTANAAVDAGYADQPHLANSLRKIMGSRPSEVDDIHKL